MRFVRTLRARLTVWYCLAMAGGLLVFGVLLFGLAQTHLVEHYDEPLRARGVKVLRILADQEEGQDLSPMQVVQLSHMGRVQIIEKGPSAPQIMFRSPGLPDGLSGLVAALPSDDASQPAFDTLQESGVQWRVYSLRFHLKNGRSGVIRVIEDLGNVGSTLHHLLIDFLHLAPVGILISFLGGFWLSGRALRPISRIIETAKEIEASKLDQRLPDPGLEGEIGSLVKTLNRMFGRLEASFEAMKRFTSDASHELRSPLATVRNTIDITLDQPRTLEEHRAAMQSIGEEVDRIRTIVEDLLLLARADSGRVVMKRTPLRLDRLVEAQVEAQQFNAEARSMTLETRLPVAGEILGDERWLHQVLGNLVDNALKYSHPGGAVSVDLKEEDGSVLLLVHDSGPGIPEEDLERIFERFFRSDPSRSRSHVPGVGLGLAIVAWVVREHGGSIRASNRPEGGATFTVAFPKADAHG